MNRKKIAVLVSAVFVIAASALLIVNLNQKEKNTEMFTTEAIVPCTDQAFVDSLWGGAVFISREDRVKELEALVKSIKESSGYETSADCMYVITRASMVFDSVEIAESNLIKLKSEYEKTGYRSNLKDFALSIADLESRIAIIKEARSKNMSNGSSIDNSFNGSITQ